MARQTVYTDDLDGTVGAEPVQFGWDNVTWELDLSPDNRDKLAELLAPYLEVAHPVHVAATEPVRQARRRGSAPAGDKIDYSQPEYAGNPHRGRVNPAEAEYVRENLEAVNRRLEAEGLRTIDSSDAKMAERYGL